MTDVLTSQRSKPRIERIGGGYVQVSFPAGHGVARYFIVRREGSTWTLSRARGLDRPPRIADGWRTQRDAIAEAVRWNAEEAARDAEEWAS